MNISPFCCDITSGTPEEQQECKRLKSLGKNPHDIIIEGRNQPKP